MQNKERVHYRMSEAETQLSRRSVQSGEPHVMTSVEAEPTRVSAAAAPRGFPA